MRLPFALRPRSTAATTRRAFRAAVELLEDRRTPAYLFVDFGDNLGSGLGTTILGLREPADAPADADKVLGPALLGSFAGPVDIDPTARTITRTGPGSFLADGFGIGGEVRLTGTANNNGTFRIQSATANKLTLQAGPALTQETAAAADLLLHPSSTVSVRQNPSLTANRRALMMDVVRRAFRPFDITVVELTATPQTLADGRSVIGAASVAAAVANLRGGNAASRDAYILAADFTVDGAAITNAASGGQSPVGRPLGAAADKDTGRNRHDDLAVVYVGPTNGNPADFTNTMNNLAHEAGHLFGLQHSLTNPATDPATNLLHQAEIMSYQNTNNTSSSMFTRYPMVRGDDNSPATGTSPVSYDDLGPRNADTYYDQLATDPGVGGNLTFVSGTGAHDVITIRRDGPLARVTVEAFATADHTPGTAIPVPGTTSIRIGPVTLPLPGTTVFEYFVPLTRPILVYGGDGADRFVIDTDLGVPVEVDGMLGDDTLVLDGKGAAAVTYSPMPTVPLGTDLLRSAGSSVIDNVPSREGVLASGTTTVFFRDFDAASSVTVTNAGTVTLVTPFSRDDLTVDGSAAGLTRVQGTSDGTAFVPLITAGVVKVVLDAASQDASGGGSGDDQVQVNLPDNSSLSLAVHTGAGSDDLAFNDATNIVALGTTAYTIDADRISRTAFDTVPAFRIDTARLEFDGVEDLTVYTGLTVNLIYLRGSQPSTALTIQGGPAANLLTVEGTDGTLDAINSPVHFFGAIGYDTVSIIDHAPGGGQHRVAGGDYTRIRSGRPNLVVTYPQVEQVRVETSAAPGAPVGIVVTSTPAPVIIRQYGPDSNGVTIGEAGSVRGIRHDVTIDNERGNRTFLKVDDSADTTYQGNVVVSADAITGLTGGTIRFTAHTDLFPESSLRGLQISHGKGGSKTVVTATPPQSAVTIDGGAGADEVVARNLALYFAQNGTHDLYLHGNGDADTLRLDDTDLSVQASYSLQVGILRRTVRRFATTVATLHHDTFETVEVYGGTGNDRATVLSARPGEALTVDGGPGDDRLFGGNGTELFRGGKGNDVLVGNAGFDVLQGEDGRDLLIGGAGSDTVDGGDGEDIVIGPYTSFDAGNLDALEAIMREWTRIDLDGGLVNRGYRQRVNHLLTGNGGLNGGTLLSVAGAQRTVFDDVDLDQLRGGPALDWFLANPDVDLLPDLERGEVVTRLHGGLLQADVTVNARALSGDYFWLDGVRYSRDTVMTFTLKTGQHSLLSGGGSPIYFTVTSTGSVDYDPGLEGILTGRGTATLALRGVAVTIDARDLTIDRLNVNGTAFDGATFAPLTLRVLPGRQYCGQAGGLVEFDVRTDGTVAFATTLEGILAGQETNTLFVHGVAFAIDARRLNTGWLGVDGITFDPAAVLPFRLLPGGHFLVTPFGTTLQFTVTSDGTVGYDPSLDGFVSGRGTTTLELVGMPVTIDARVFGNTSLYFDGLFFDASAIYHAWLLPGTHGIHLGSTFLTFTVGLDGRIDYDAAYDGLLAGRGTTTLTFR